jgi:predicted enzyme related to lactoylglutathione lyase
MLPMNNKQSVLGIGGVFLKARDPVGLAVWYRENLGLPIEPSGTYATIKEDQAVAVWATFPSDTKYLGSDSSSFMLNYRVRDLAAMLTQLRQAGATVDDKIEDYDYGRFGWATDPEGNRFELWEPK